MLIWSSDVTLENLTVVPVSLSTVLLRWNINPTNGHHCIVNFSIQVSDKDGSRWKAQTLGNNKSFLLTELQLTPLKEYTYCITANTIHPNQAGPTVKQKSTVELHGMFEHTTCKRLTVMNQYNTIINFGRELQKVGGPKCTAIVYLSLYFPVKWGVLPSLPYILLPIQWNPLLRTSKKFCLISTFDQVLKMDSLIVPQTKVSSIAISCLYSITNAN